MRRWIFILLFFLALLSPGSLQGQTTEDGNVIDIEVAISAASKYLPQFYKGNWTYYTHFTYYDLDNKPRAYAIVFNRMESETESLEETKEMMERKYLEIKGYNDRINSIRNNPQLSGKEKNRLITELYRKTNSIKDSIRGIERLATVLTGAVDTLPVVLKCHKGMPEAFFKELDVRDKLSEEFPGKQFNISNVFYLGLFDVFYNLSATHSIGEKELLFHLRTGKLVSLGEIRAKYEERKLLSKQKSDSSRIQKNKERWGQFKQSKKAQPNNSNVYKDSTSQEKLHRNNAEVKRLSKESKETENAQQLNRKVKSSDKVKTEKKKQVKAEMKKDVALKAPGNLEKSKEEKK